MRSKRSNTAAKSSPGAGEDTRIFPFFEAPTQVRPGELVAISVGLRLLNKKGIPSDYFDEAMQLVKQAHQFLRQSGPQPMKAADALLAKRLPEDRIKLEEIDDPLIKRLAASNLTFENLLCPVSEPRALLDSQSRDKRKKPDTWFGAISTAKGLRSLIQDSQGARVLTTSEAQDILKRKKMDVYQFLRLRVFQTERNRTRGKHATASRQAKSPSKQPPND